MHEWNDDDEIEIRFMMCAENSTKANKMVLKAFKHFPLLEQPSFIKEWTQEDYEEYHFLFSIQMQKQFVVKYFELFEKKNNRKIFKHIISSCVMNTEETLDHEDCEHCFHL